MEVLDQPSLKNKPVNFKRELLRYLRKWPWFVLSILLFYSAARVYLRYAEPQYLSKTALMLSENNSKNNTALSDLKNLGMGVSGDQELQGETVVIVSKPILAQVAQKLNLNVSYFTLGTIKETENYHGPLKAEITALRGNGKFSGSYSVVSPDTKGALRITEGDGAGRQIRNGDTTALSFGTVRWTFVPEKVQSPVKVVFRSIPSVVSSLESAVSVSLPEDKGLLMELSMVGTVPQKSEEILDAISQQYNIDGIKDKNTEAQNTQDFINERLDIISRDLSGIETEKEQFKRNNRITDLEAQAGLALNNLNTNTRQLLNLSTQYDLVSSIYGMSAKEQLLPSNMGLSQTTETYIAQYNTLLMTRNRVLKQATSKNPSVIQLNHDIEEARSVLRKNLIENREALQIQIGQLQGEVNSDRSQIDRYPTQEKVFRTIDRNQQLKEQLYLYLLQKREENAITLAVTAPKAKVVNPAYTLGQVKPNVKQVTMGALAVGFLLPMLVFFTLFTLDTRVRTKQQIVSEIPDVPVLAEIPVSESDTMMVSENDFSVYAESFRILGSNLKYLLRTATKKDGGTVLITSSIKGEGKTTVAINLALVLAGKARVLLLGADIRNPQLHRFMQNRNRGITDYLVSDDDDPARYIHHSQIHANLDVMFSGAMAPNPNDLLDMQKFDDLVAWAHQHYEYVVMDSAPVMLVSDTLHLLDKADTVLYVVKSGYTDKEMLAFAQEFRQNNNIHSMAFVLNNVKPEYSRYGYKYGYGYYNRPSRQSLLKGLFKKK